MPLWKVYHPVGAYSAQDKKEFAEKVTETYSRVPIPKFYVVMIFEEVAAESVYVGGVPHGKFVRFKIDQMARTLPGHVVREWWVKAVDQLIAPYVRDRGMTGKSPSMSCRPIFGRCRVKFLLPSNPTPKNDG